MGTAGVKPRRVPRWAVATETCLRDHKAPSGGIDDRGQYFAPVVAAGERDEFQDRQLNMGAAAIVLMIVCGD